MLLSKLKEDGAALCRKNRLKEAAHRFSYALRKIPSDCDSEELSVTFTTLRLHLTLNLSRTKRKMNVRVAINYFFSLGRLLHIFKERRHSVIMK